MPSVVGSLLKAVFFGGVTFFLYAQGQMVGTVERTLISDGKLSAIAVEAHDETYRDEISAAQRKAIPYYAAAAIMALASVTYLRKASRIHKRAQRRDPHEFTARS